jgi:MFS family permease
MDHTGAIIGPLIATAILFFAPGEYRMVFALTIIPGAIAVALLFLVPEPEDPSHVGRLPPSKVVPSLGGPAIARPAKRLPRRLLAFCAVLLFFSLGNSTDAFLLLRLSDELGSAIYIPLLWAGLHVVKASLSTWGGRLSDRLGRKRVIVFGWIVYAVVYAGFAVATEATAFVALFLMYGVYFALTEGAEKALVADLAPVAKRGTAFGLYNAALGVGSLGASIGFGFLYERVGASAAFGAGAALASVAAMLLLWIPTTSRP